MSCGHCVRAVNDALHDLEGVTVEGVEIGEARLAYDPDRVDPRRIRTVLEEEGYSVEGSETGR
jgi:copper chaperone